MIETNGRPARVGRAGWLSCGLAFAAAVLAATYLVGDQCPVPVAAVPLLVSATPALARTPRAFAVVCRLAAVLLIVLAVPGVFFGLPLFLPAALILLMAPTAAAQDAEFRPQVASFVSVVIFATCAVVWGTTLYEQRLAPPDAFLVTTAPEFSDRADFRNVVNGRADGIGFGATEVSLSGTGPGEGPMLTVRFPGSLSAGDRQRLADHLWELDGVRSVRPCSRWHGEC